MIAFFASPAGRWLVILVLVLAAMAAAYVHGRQFEQGLVAKDQLADERSFTERLLERWAHYRQLSTAVEKDLNAERKSRADDRRGFERKLAEAPRETLIEVCPNPEPDRSAGIAGRESDPASASKTAAVVVPRLLPDACSLWNDALAAGATAAERAGWLARANPCADSARPR